MTWAELSLGLALVLSLLYIYIDRHNRIYRKETRFVGFFQNWKEKDGDLISPDKNFNLTICDGRLMQNQRNGILFRDLFEKDEIELLTQELKRELRLRYSLMIEDYYNI